MVEGVSADCREKYNVFNRLSYLPLAVPQVVP
jgi:hypothetical protein